MLLWANAYAALNRVDRSELMGNTLTLDAVEIPISAYVPSSNDLDELRERMEIIVSRILCQHVPHFKQFYNDVVCWHISHQYSAESAKPSTLVIIINIRTITAV
jgi:hypothetical protein